MINITYVRSKEPNSWTCSTLCMIRFLFLYCSMCWIRTTFLHPKCSMLNLYITHAKLILLWVHLASMYTYSRLVVALRKKITNNLFQDYWKETLQLFTSSKFATNLNTFKWTAQQLKITELPVWIVYYTYCIKLFFEALSGAFHPTEYITCNSKLLFCWNREIRTPNPLINRQML